MEEELAQRVTSFPILQECVLEGLKSRVGGAVFSRPVYETTAPMEYHRPSLLERSHLFCPLRTLNSILWVRLPVAQVQLLQVDFGLVRTVGEKEDKDNCGGRFVAWF